MSYILGTKQLSQSIIISNFPWLEYKKQQQQKTTGLLSEKQGLERRPQSCGITCEFLKRITDEQRKTKAQRSEMI